MSTGAAATRPRAGQGGRGRGAGRGRACGVVIVPAETPLPAEHLHCHVEGAQRLPGAIRDAPHRSLVPRITLFGDNHTFRSEKSPLIGRSLEAPATPASFGPGRGVLRAPAGSTTGTRAATDPHTRRMVALSHSHTPGAGRRHVALARARAPRHVLRRQRHLLDAPLRAPAPGQRLGPSSPFRAPLCAARTLNITGQPRVTLSLQQEHLRAVCRPCQEERSLKFAPKTPSQRGAVVCNTTVDAAHPYACAPPLPAALSLPSAYSACGPLSSTESLHAHSRHVKRIIVVFRSLILKGPSALSKLMINIHMVLLVFF